MQTPADRKAAVDEKIINLYAINIQLIPKNEFAPKQANGGSTEGMVTREYINIDSYNTDGRGRPTYVGTKG
jgi:hypothetical protein